MWNLHLRQVEVTHHNLTIKACFGDLIILGTVPSGKHTKTMEHHHFFKKTNQLFLWTNLEYPVLSSPVWFFFSVTVYFVRCSYILKKMQKQNSCWAYDFMKKHSKQQVVGYPLVNYYITMENHHAMKMGKLTISMAMFNSYVSHNQRVNLHFPRVFLWFSH